MLFSINYGYHPEKWEKGADMADFTPINTQEEFEAAMKDRLAREAKKFEGYTSPADLEKIKTSHKAEVDKLNADMAAKLKEKDDSIAEKDAKIKGYETSSAKMRIARETGLSYEAMDYIQGSDEESMKKSAEELLNMAESLAIMMQDSAEAGNLDSSIYADVAELMGYIAAIARDMIRKDAA